MLGFNFDKEACTSVPLILINGLELEASELPKGIVIKLNNDKEI